MGAREIKTEELSVPATIGANGDGPAMVEVAIANGDDVPVKLAGVRLEMRQRQLCFDGPGRRRTRNCSMGMPGSGPGV